MFQHHTDSDSDHHAIENDLLGSAPSYNTPGGGFSHYDAPRYGGVHHSDDDDE